MMRLYEHLSSADLERKLKYVMDQLDQGSSSFALEATLQALLAEQAARCND